MTQAKSNRHDSPHIKRSPPKRSPPKRTRGGTQPLPLSRDDIVRAALPVLERVGIDGLTVRSVADELGISSPAMYHYFPGREALIDRLCEQVTAQIDVRVAPDTPWDDAIVQVLSNLDRSFARYHGVAARVLPSHKPSPAADHISSTVYALIRKGGFQPDDAEQVLLALQYLLGGRMLGKPARWGAKRAPTDSLERSIRWLLTGAQQAVTPTVTTPTMPTPSTRNHSTRNHSTSTHSTSTSSGADARETDR
jgi:TetR/AcrR family tetracycline transcriptional repressor